MKTKNVNCLIRAFPLVGLGNNDLWEGHTGTPCVTHLMMQFMQKVSGSYGEGSRKE